MRIYFAGLPVPTEQGEPEVANLGDLMGFWMRLSLFCWKKVKRKDNALLKVPPAFPEFLLVTVRFPRSGWRISPPFHSKISGITCVCRTHFCYYHRFAPGAVLLKRSVPSFSQNSHQIVDLVLISINVKNSQGKLTHCHSTKKFSRFLLVSKCPKIFGEPWETDGTDRFSRGVVGSFFQRYACTNCLEDAFLSHFEHESPPERCKASLFPHWFIEWWTTFCFLFKTMFGNMKPQCVLKNVCGIRNMNDCVEYLYSISFSRTLSWELSCPNMLHPPCIEVILNRYNYENHFPSHSSENIFKKITRHAGQHAEN